MVLRHRQSPSPFEVMSTITGTGVTENPAGQPSQGRGATHPSPRADESQPLESPPHQGVESWLKRAQHPMVLRLPQGYAVLIGVVLIGLLAVAYWTGQSRGYRRGTQLQLAASDPTPAPVAIADLNSRSPGVDRPDNETAIANFPQILTLTDDPRQVDHNYFVLAHYPRADAERLVGFLSDEGVKAAAVRPKGKDHFQVIALRSFTKEQLESEAYEQYKQRLLRLGRHWHSKGLGQNFYGIFAAKYKGEPATEILTKETIR